MLLCSYLGTFIFLTFTLCSFLSSACSSRMAFTFVWRNKSKQKYALLNQSASAEITAVPLLFIFLRVLFLLTVVVAFTSLLIGNLSVATISFIGARQRTTQIQFMFFLLVRLRFNFHYVFYLALVFLPIYSDLPTQSAMRCIKEKEFLFMLYSWKVQQNFNFFSRKTYMSFRMK